VLPTIPDSNHISRILDSNPHTSTPPKTFPYQAIYVKAKIAYIKLEGEEYWVGFKLAEDSISALAGYYRKFIHRWIGSQKDWTKEQSEGFEQQLKTLIYRTDIGALQEGIEIDGSGELLGERSNEMKEKIQALIAASLKADYRRELYWDISMEMARL
jgi:hypothetical protein